MQADGGKKWDFLKHSHPIRLWPKMAGALNTGDLVACMVSDGDPRQWTSETVLISHNGFQKSFLWQQAQSVIILRTDSRHYGMTVF
jgi:hypothetical protein